MSLFRRGVLFALSLILILCTALSLSGCEKDEKIVRAGLSLSESDSLTERDSMRSSAFGAVLPILSDYYRNNGKNISEDAVREEASAIAEMTLSDKIGVTDHALLTESLKKHREKIAPILSADSFPDLNLLGEVYIALTENVSSDFIGEFLYKLCLYSFDKKINKHLSVGDAVNNVLANAAKAEKTIFEEHIGEDSFTELVRLMLMSRALFVTEGDITDIYDKFTDAEVLLIIQRHNLSGITASPEGYLLLAQYYSDSMILWEDSYCQSELFYEATYNGDLEAFLSKVDKLLELIDTVKNSLTKEDVALIKAGDTEGLISSIFTRFGEREWTLFEEITAISVKNARYCSIAERFFGEEFKSYAESGEPVSLEELHRGVGGEDFYNLLEGYVFGISPAFSYGMKK